MNAPTLSCKHVGDSSTYRATDTEELNRTTPFTSIMLCVVSLVGHEYAMFVLHQHNKDYAGARAVDVHSLRPSCRSAGKSSPHGHTNCTTRSCWGWRSQGSSASLVTVAVCSVALTLQRVLGKCYARSWGSALCSLSVLPPLLRMVGFSS